MDHGRVVCMQCGAEVEALTTENGTYMGSWCPACKDETPTRWIPPQAVAQQNA